MRLVKRKLHIKAQKHDQIRTVAETKLNSISELVSEALQDGQISDREFKTVIDKLDLYNKPKYAIRIKQPQRISQDEKKTDTRRKRTGLKHY